MSHRVVDVGAVVEDKSKADSLKNEIDDKLDTEGYGLHERKVLATEAGQYGPRVSVKTDHNVDSEADKFYDFLENLLTSEETDSDGNTVTVTATGVVSCRGSVHDCKHLEGLSQSCRVDFNFDYGEV